MAGPMRVSPEEVRQKVTSGSSLLVCAYEDDEKCKRLHLEGSIWLTEFKAELARCPGTRRSSSIVPETRRQPLPVRRRGICRRGTAT